MNFVQPIKEKGKIEEIKEYFKSENKWKLYLMFVIGINSSLRISDILNLKWQDVSTDGQVKKAFKLKEKKTGKWKEVTINRSFAEAIEEYWTHKGSGSGYIFSSKSNRNKGKPWSRQYAWKALKRAAKEVGIEDMGTHSLRKTFAYHAYKAGVALELLMNTLNHSTQAMTLKYIGITGEDVENVYNTINL